MKFKAGLTRFLLYFVLVLFFAASAFAASFFTESVANADGFSAEGKSAYLVDATTGRELYAKNENERLPVASMVKLMTVLLTLEAEERGELSYDEDITVSERAASMGGSQIFLDAGSVHKAGDLLKSVIIASANDSCVALAERIGGSVEGFVESMNARARELGMQNTNFANCTGLPAAEGFSSARDMAVLLKEVCTHPEYYGYAGVWLEDYTHPGGRMTTMTNTNKLVRFYDGCDGGKTGFTSEAKFCLAATAKREDMRVIAVVVGADSSKGRFNAVSSMFNYAFGNYKTEVLVAAGEEIDEKVKVSSGKEKSLALTVTEDIATTTAKNDKSEVTLRFELPDKVKAPVKKGDVVGKGYVLRDGAVEREFDVVAAKDVRRASIWDLIKRIGSPR